MRSAKMATVLILLAWGASQSTWAQPVVMPPPGPGPHFFISTGGGFPPMPPMIIPPLLMGMQAAHLTAEQRISERAIENVQFALLAFEFLRRDCFMIARQGNEQAAQSEVCAAILIVGVSLRVEHPGTLPRAAAQYNSDAAASSDPGRSSEPATIGVNNPLSFFFPGAITMAEFQASDASYWHSYDPWWNPNP